MFQLETISPGMLDYYVGQRNVQIIDLRSEEEYKAGHVRSAFSIPYEKLEFSKEIQKEKLLIFVCDRGGASLLAAKKYAQAGWKTRSVIGGMQAYHGRNLVISP